MRPPNLRTLDSANALDHDSNSTYTLSCAQNRWGHELVEILRYGHCELSQQCRRYESTRSRRAIGDLDAHRRAAGNCGDEHAFGSILRDQLPHRAHEDRRGSLGASDQIGKGGHRRMNLTSIRCNLSHCCHEPEQRDHRSRSSTSVDPDMIDMVTASSGDGVEDVALHRVIDVQIVLRRPIALDTGRQHSRMLPRAVHRQPRAGSSLSQQRLSRVTIQGEIFRGSEIAVVQTGGGQQ